LPSALARLYAAAAAAAAHSSSLQHQQQHLFLRRGVSTSTTSSSTADSPETTEAPAATNSPSPVPLSPARPELVARFLSDDALSRRGRLQARKGDAVSRFARSDGDVGSPEVQVALATERIRDLAEHFRTHKKDHHSRRGLQALLNRRRRLLSYLRESDFERFCGVLAALGLERDTYARQRRADSYRTGSALGAAAERLPRIALSAADRRSAAASGGAARRKKRRAHEAAAAAGKKAASAGGAIGGGGGGLAGTGAPMA
jgi:small subunit ribosomal protein S15